MGRYLTNILSAQNLCTVHVLTCICCGIFKGNVTLRQNDAAMDSAWDVRRTSPFQHAVVYNTIRFIGAPPTTLHRPKRREVSTKTTTKSIVNSLECWTLIPERHLSRSS